MGEATQTAPSSGGAGPGSETSPAAPTASEFPPAPTKGMAEVTPTPQGRTAEWPWHPVVTGAVMALIGIGILVVADLLLGRWIDRGGGS
jgi:hypothetical protein